MLSYVCMPPAQGIEEPGENACRTVFPGAALNRPPTEGRAIGTCIGAPCFLSLEVLAEALRCKRRRSSANSKLSGTIPEELDTIFDDYPEAVANL
eukprot:2157858-Pleurochrysis_carterae.AAC.2